MLGVPLERITCLSTDINVSGKAMFLKTLRKWSINGWTLWHLLYSGSSRDCMALLSLKWSIIRISSNLFYDISSEIISLPILLFQYIVWVGNFTIPMYKTIPITFLWSSIWMFCTFLSLKFKHRHALYSLVWSTISSKRSSMENNLKNSMRFKNHVRVPSGILSRSFLSWSTK